MVLRYAVGDSAVGEIDEEQVCEGVDDFGGVLRRVVVLFAPVEGAGDGGPVAIVARWWVGYAWEFEWHGW